MFMLTHSLSVSSCYTVEADETSFLEIMDWGGGGGGGLVRICALPFHTNCAVICCHFRNCSSVKSLSICIFFRLNKEN